MPFDTLPAAPLFPGGYTNARVELLLSGTWTDVTPYTFRTPLTVTRGHPDESTTTTPSQCTGTFTNEDGRFAGRNPLSPWFGSLTRNTQIRVSLPEGASYLRLEGDTVSYASAPSTAGLQITGDMDVQLDLTLDNWNGSLMLAGMWNETGNQRSWLLLLNDTGSLTLLVSGDGSTSHSRFSQVPLPVPPLGRQCVRVTWAHSTGTATFYTSPPGLSSPVWTQVDQLSAPTVTSLFASTAPVQLGYCTGAPDLSQQGVNGKIHAFLLLSGIGGTTEASPDFTVQPAGTTSFSDAQSNTWTLAGTSEISGRKYRYHGELAAVPQMWAPTFRQAWCDFTASGVLRRLQQRSIAICSAFYRYWVRQTGTAAPVAYWPCEDATGSSSFASMTGGPAMTFGGPTQVASNSSFACSAPLPVFNGAQWYGVIPPYATPASDVISFIAQVPSGGDTNNGFLCRVYTTGTVRMFELGYGTGGVLSLSGYDINGSSLFNTGPQPFGVNGEQLLYIMQLNTSGSNVTYSITTYQPAASTGLTFGGTLTSASVGAVTSVAPNAGGLLTGTVAGHFSVQPTTALFTSLISSALAAWNGETAGNRMQRLCGEEGLGFRGKGQLAASAAMGNQTLQTITALLQECADTDRGIIFQPRQVLGLGYRCLNAIEAQSAAGRAPAVSWDFGQDQMDMPSAWPLEDDQRTINDVTVTSATGSSSRQQLTSGLMSVQAPPAGVGRYQQSFTVNPQTDTVLPHIAGWVLNVSSVDEPRYPSVRADLGNFSLTPAQFYAILDADIGDLISGANPPGWLPPGAQRQLIQGVTETIWVKQLAVDWAAVPASPYDVAVVGDPVYGHADTDGSTVNTGISASATTMLVTSTNTALPLWTTAAGDVPFDIKVNFGEVMTVTNITGASSPQPFTVIRGVNGVAVAHSAGEDVRLAHPMILALT